MWSISRTVGHESGQKINLWVKGVGGGSELVAELVPDGVKIEYYPEESSAKAYQGRIGSICWGWWTISVEKNQMDAILDRVSSATHEDQALCNHEFSCEREIFHVAHVILGNLECEGCEACSRYK